MKKIIIILSILLCHIVNAQTEEILSIKADFEAKTTKLSNDMKMELKKLPQKNYSENKRLIENKYSKLYSVIENEKNNKIVALEKIENERNIQKNEILKFENEKKQREENELSEIKLEKERQELQKIKLAEKKRADFEKSNLGMIQKKVKIIFEAWLIKDEYETTENYTNRIKNESPNKFQKIKDSIQKQFVKPELGNWMYANYWDYDIDSQLLKIKYKSQGYNESYRDSVQIFVPVLLSKFIKSQVSKPKNHSSSNFIIFPLEKKLVNNNYEYSKLMIVFPLRMGIYEGGIGGGFNDFGRSDVLRYTQLKKENNKYFLTSSVSVFFLDINSGNLKYPLYDMTPYLNDDKLPNKVLYYIWEDKNIKEQDMNFTIEDIGVKIP